MIEQCIDCLKVLCFVLFLKLIKCLSNHLKKSNYYTIITLRHDDILLVFPIKKKTCSKVIHTYLFIIDYNRIYLNVMYT